MGCVKTLTSGHLVDIQPNGNVGGTTGNAFIPSHFWAGFFVLTKKI